MDVSFLKLAEIELDEAIQYYEQEQPGLGMRFKTEVQRSLFRIIEFPTAYQALSNNSRRCLIAKFPYSVIYQYQKSKNRILVVAVAHLHRKPDYWISR
ncbi:hypothetical protein R50073_08220 [Maricurvus nonylphenolicus]|uniref:type II toxin-antitoxin system RelE/ParE family toxin n=1 Tax=Maricurvus nonylphenolicus TaxID=1008307 RepID=UPI0036F2F895